MSLTSQVADAEIGPSSVLSTTLARAVPFIAVDDVGKAAQLSLVPAWRAYFRVRKSIASGVFRRASVLEERRRSGKQGSDVQLYLTKSVPFLGREETFTYHDLLNFFCV